MPKGSLDPRRSQQRRPDQYDGCDGQLVACEFDANDMAALAAERGFDSRKLITADATSEALLTALGTAADALVEDDILRVSYAAGSLPSDDGALCSANESATRRSTAAGGPGGEPNRPGAATRPGPS